MLDTNTASYVVTGRYPGVRVALQEITGKSRVALSSIAQAEILYGLERKPEAYKLRKDFTTLFSKIEVLPWTSEAAHAYGRVRSALNTAGLSLSPIDMLIASHAIALGAVLVSHDQAFRQLGPWLTVVDWATDV